MNNGEMGRIFPYRKNSFNFLFNKDLKIKQYFTNRASLERNLKKLFL